MNGKRKGQRGGEGNVSTFHTQKQFMRGSIIQSDSKVAAAPLGLPVKCCPGVGCESGEGEGLEVIQCAVAAKNCSSTCTPRPPAPRVCSVKATSNKHFYSHKFLYHLSIYFAPPSTMPLPPSPPMPLAPDLFISW